MKTTFTIATLFWILLLSTAGLSLGQKDKEESRDDNVAFFEGETLNYVIYPPRGFKLILDEAMGDGYSMAFIPEDLDYTNTTALVSVNIFSPKKSRRADLIDDFIVEDTLEMRAFYGDAVLIMPVDSVLNSQNEILPAFFLEDKENFLPHVMSAYYSGAGGDEIIVFELHINESRPRFEAEEVFIDCIRRFKPLKRGELDEK